MSFFVKAVHRRAEGDPGGQRRDRRRPTSSTRTTIDIGVAVGTEQGPGRAGGARRRRHVASPRSRRRSPTAGQRARDGKLTIDDLQGGTFTISNGGVYGSLMSTPILNPPQSGILGMHKIQERPVALDGQVVIRPMMYLALSYDHRIVDGREAVTFLVRVKECSRTRRGCCWTSMIEAMASTTSSSSAAAPAATSRAIRAAQLGLKVAVRREGRDPRRHLPERRLHPVEGAAACLRAVRRGAATSFAQHRHRGRQRRSSISPR